MPSDSYQSDADIIRAAYADKVKENFKVFAENLGMGQAQKASLERFLRSLDLVRTARDMALEATSGALAIASTESSAAASPQTDDALSAEDQALIDQALAGTTGARPMPPQPQRRR